MWTRKQQGKTLFEIQFLCGNFVQRNCSKKTKMDGGEGLSLATFFGSLFCAVVTVRCCPFVLDRSVFYLFLSSLQGTGSVDRKRGNPEVHEPHLPAQIQHGLETAPLQVLRENLLRRLHYNGPRTQTQKPASEGR
jgi:hypothetical protein